ncbi:hypothetical protein [Staphylococcus epidermidis]|uniref:hypothetical protein n=1 Tax=Staphylococcus epidermidis TaxID=1282 RepID=UPI000DFDF7AF|nr:hypothetical protein [Staphylococcus epidermidis]MCD8925840.1 hypothetical protein [Staphylococcus epidermidis]SUM28078.1 Uncharacterised protein [Staphylococcus epidermidis]
MKFTTEMVNKYLTLVNDENPIHRSIVPGQLICEKVFFELNVYWMDYKIKYLKPINIDEEVQFLIKENDEIVVFKTYDDIKLTITRS